MEVVEHIIVFSLKLDSIQQFCEFSKDIHKIAKCTKNDCPIEIYNNSLRKTVFNPELDYDFPRIFCVKQSVEYPKLLNLCFGYRIKVKKK